MSVFPSYFINDGLFFDVIIYGDVAEDSTQTYGTEEPIQFR